MRTQTLFSLLGRRNRKPNLIIFQLQLFKEAAFFQAIPILFHVIVVAACCETVSFFHVCVCCSYSIGRYMSIEAVTKFMAFQNKNIDIKRYIKRGGWVLP